MNRGLTVSLLVVPLLSALVRADDANWVTVGTGGSFRPNPHIRMLRETVDIKLDDKVMNVHATFLFKNEGPDQLAKIGFPDEMALQFAQRGTAMNWFRTKVDGISVKAVHRRLKTTMHPWIGIEAFRSAWVKRVWFNSGQTRRVEVRYEVDNGFAASGWILNTYVFKTGATWKGTIGRIEATVDWSRLKTWSRPSLKLTAPVPNVRWTDLGYRKAKLVIEDVKPKFDLELTMVDGFWNFHVNHQPLRPLTRHAAGSLFTGRPNDLLVSISEVPFLWCSYIYEGTKSSPKWRAQLATLLGDECEKESNRTLRFKTGRTLRLRRPAITIDDEAYVYLADVVQALGGRLTYQRELERVDIWMPWKFR